MVFVSGVVGRLARVVKRRLASLQPWSGVGVRVTRDGVVCLASVEGEGRFLRGPWRMVRVRVMRGLVPSLASVERDVGFASENDRGPLRYSMTPRARPRPGFCMREGSVLKVFSFGIVCVWDRLVAPPRTEPLLWVCGAMVVSSLPGLEDSASVVPVDLIGKQPKVDTRIPPNASATTKKVADDAGEREVGPILLLPVTKTCLRLHPQEQ